MKTSASQAWLLIAASVTCGGSGSGWLWSAYTQLERFGEFFHQQLCVSMLSLLGKSQCQQPIL